MAKHKTCGQCALFDKLHLRDYQVDLAQQGHKILAEKGIVYLAMEVRTGKTLTALEIARLFSAKNVLFLTKKKAIPSIQSDYKALAPGYDLIVINNENLHKLQDSRSYDLLIHDESHRLGSYAKPCQSVQKIRKMFGHLPQIHLSGTPTPESWSQIYHQFWASNRSPFSEQTFYKWAGNICKPNYVDVRQRVLPQGTINDYSRGIEKKILPVIEPYMIRFTQEDAGFKVKLHEHFCYVPMPSTCKVITDRLMESGVVKGSTGVISAENAAALQMKIRQIQSGSIILDPQSDEIKGRSIILSTAKADYIKDKWPVEKLVIFYVFKQELNIIKSVLGNRVTTDLKTFQMSNNSQSIALQIQSGREGIRLSDGELIVFFSLGHSSVSYWQGRDRLTTIDRLESNVYWLFSAFDGNPGIDKEIYNVVQHKKKFTTAHFKKIYKKQLNKKFW